MDWRHDQGDQPPRVDNGRWILDVPNGLEIVVSEAALPWALDYLDDVFRMLQLAGATVARAPMKDKERATNDEGYRFMTVLARTAASVFYDDFSLRRGAISKRGLPSRRFSV